MSTITMCAALAMLHATPPVPRNTPQNSVAAERAEQQARAERIPQLHAPSTSALVQQLDDRDSSVVRHADSALFARLHSADPLVAADALDLLIKRQRQTKDRDKAAAAARLISTSATGMAGQNRDVAIKHMQDVLRSGPGDVGVALPYVKALMDLDHGKTTLEILESLLARPELLSQDEYLRTVILTRLGMYGDAGLPTLTRYLLPDSRGQTPYAIDALSGIAADPSETAFGILSASARQGVDRGAAVGALAEWASHFPPGSEQRTRVNRIILEYAGDHDQDVVESAIEAQKMLVKYDLTQAELANGAAKLRAGDAAGH